MIKYITDKVMTRYYLIRYGHYKDKFYMWLAWKLPRELIKWSSIRLISYATMGKYGKDHPDDVSVITALNRWDHPND